MAKRIILAPIKLLSVIIIVLQLFGCISENSDGTASSTETVISGSVGDGPVVGATLNIYDKDGNLLQTEISDNSASYSTRIKVKGNAYPLTIEAVGGTDLVTGRAPDFKLITIATNPSKKFANINPYTTVIVESARSMQGGLNNENISTATATVMDQLNFGLDPASVADPVNTEITDDNIAAVVKSSESFGEAIRRARDNLVMTGTVANGDDVIDAIADDLTDGFLDGSGAVLANSEVAAVTTLASAQVILESLSNNLKVDGVRATDAMDNAILMTQPTTSAAALTASVPVNNELLAQARTSIEAASVLAPSAELSTVADIVATIQAGSLASDIEQVLPGDSGQALDQALALVPSATDEQLNAVNSMVSSGIGSSDSAPVNNEPVNNEPVNNEPVNNEPVNNAPVISGTPVGSVAENSTYSFQPTASDADGDTLTFSIQNRPSWASFNSTSGQLSGTPSNSDAGSYSNISITVSDGSTSDSLGPFSITVNDTNQAPVIGGSPASSVAENSTYSFQPTASDADGDTLTFSIQNRPSWASFNNTSGQLSGTPSNGDSGTYNNISISVSDGTTSISLPAFPIVVNTILPSNTAPTINGTPLSSVAEGSPYSFQPTASDADGDTLTFSIQNTPSWASFNSTSGQLSGTPSNSDAGSYGNISITVSDGTTSDSLGPFSITVNDTNQAPVIGGSPASSVAENSTYSFQPTASDADGDTLTFSIQNRPSWASFNTTSGQLSGTPSNSAAGSYGNISITVSDGSTSDSLGPFSITVNDTNQAPVIAGTPAGSVDENSAYNFQPTASDADGDTLTFSIQNRPSWASFNTTSGQLSGTPSNSTAGSYGNISITVSDGSTSDSLGPFSITVNDTNQAPVIAGTPAGSVDENSAYNFQPTASDADGDTLTFSIQNRPSWASFNTTSGQLSGTPSNSDAGDYANIVISVSDGSKTIALSAFSITVNTVAQQLGSISLSWTEPVAREDGDALALSEIAGYTIHYGTSPDDYTYSIDINGADTTSVTINDLPLGDYYIVATTRDVEDRVSSYSNMAIKQAQ